MMINTFFSSGGSILIFGTFILFMIFPEQTDLCYNIVKLCVNFKICRLLKYPSPQQHTQSKSPTFFLKNTCTLPLYCIQKIYPPNKYLKYYMSTHLKKYTSLNKKCPIKKIHTLPPTHETKSRF